MDRTDRTGRDYTDETRLDRTALMDRTDRTGRDWTDRTGLHVDSAHTLSHCEPTFRHMSIPSLWFQFITIVAGIK